MPQCLSELGILKLLWSDFPESLVWNVSPYLSILKVIMCFPTLWCREESWCYTFCLDLSRSQWIDWCLKIYLQFFLTSRWIPLSELHGWCVLILYCVSAVLFKLGPFVCALIGFGGWVLLKDGIWSVFIISLLDRHLFSWASVFWNNQIHSLISKSSSVTLDSSVWCPLQLAMSFSKLVTRQTNLQKQAGQDWFHPILVHFQETGCNFSHNGEC